jgi:hypothetical protein
MATKPKTAVRRSRHKALAELNDRVTRVYEKTVDAMFDRLLEYVSKEIVGQKLTKSDPMYGFASDVDWPPGELVAFASSQNPQDRLRAQQKFSLLTPTQLETIKGIIRDHHLAFAAGVFGPDAIPAGDLQRLIATGLTPSDLSTVLEGTDMGSFRVMDLAYQYGMQLGTPAQQGAVKDMGVDKFQEHLAATRSELSTVDRQAMAWSRYNAGQYIRGMADRLSLETGVLIANADAEQRRKYLGTVRRELEANIDRRGEWRKLASELGHATGDWSRDVQRLAATEQQFAMQEGQARAIARGREGKEVRVVKMPTPDACDACVRLHLTAGKGSKPRIFKLSELQANGTNVGVKKANWKPVVGPVHPWCECELMEVPDGWGFDDDGEMVPEAMLKKGDRLDWAEEALLKGDEAAHRPHMTHGAFVPTRGCIVRVSDPQKRQLIERILEEAPPQIFDRNIGVTLITSDTPRAQNPLEDHDFAYWTANEIRINQTLPIERLPRVLRHELGHSLNVWLMKQLGGADSVRRWHDELWELSKQEGFVSDYATKLPIENAAEATRMYLFEKPRLMLHFPQTFAFLHRYYRPIFEAA